MAASNDLFGKNPSPMDLFQPISDKELFTVKPPTVSKPTKKELAALKEEQDLAEWDAISTQYINDPAFKNASLARKEQQLDNWFKNQWEPYAQARYDNEEEARQAKLAIYSRIRRAYNAADKEVKSGSIIGNAVGDVGRTVDSLVDSVFHARPLANASDELKEQQRMVDDAVLARALIAENKTLDADTRSRMLEGADKTIASYSRSLQDAEKSADDLLNVWRSEREKSQKNEAERQRANPRRADRELRLSELSQEGSTDPAWDAFWEGGVSEKVGIAFNTVVGNLPNVAIPVAASVLGAAVAGPAGGMAGGALTSSGLVMSSAVQEAVERVWDMSDEELKALPNYAGLQEKGLDDKQIRARLALLAGAEAKTGGATIGAAGALLGVETLASSASPFGQVLTRAAKAMGGKAVPAILAKLGAGIAMEGLTEAGEEVLEHLNVGMAVNRATGADLPLTPGMKDAALLGGLGGMGSGGGGAVVHAYSQAQGAGATAETSDTPAATETPETPAAASSVDTAGSAEATPDLPPGTVASPAEVSADPAVPTEQGAQSLIQIAEVLDSWGGGPAPTDQQMAVMYQALRIAQRQGVSTDIITRLLEEFQASITLPPDSTANYANDYLNYSEGGTDGLVRQASGSGTTGTAGGSVDVDSTLGGVTGTSSTTIASGDTQQSVSDGTATASGGVSGTTQSNTTTAAVNETVDETVGDGQSGPTDSGRDNRQLSTTVETTGEGQRGVTAEVVQRTDSPGGAASTGTDTETGDSVVTPPKSLARSRPLFRGRRLGFESNVDQAAYLTALPKRSSKDAAYLAYAMAATGMSEPEVRAYGAQVRATIGQLSEGVEARGTISVPDQRGGRSTGDGGMLMDVSGDTSGTVSAPMTPDRATQIAAGREAVRETLARSVANGEITQELADFSNWLLDQNPHLAETLSGWFGGDRGRIAGGYNPARRLFVLFKSAKDTTGVHEIMHHAERMLPPDVQAGIRQEWAQRLDAWEARTSKQAAKDTINLIRDANANNLGNPKNLTPAQIEAARGELDILMYGGGISLYEYQFTGPSEYWAVNATHIFQRTYELETSWIGKAREWFLKLLEFVTNSSRLPADSPVLQGIHAVVNGDGTELTQSMIDLYYDTTQEFIIEDIRYDADALNGVTRTPAGRDVTQLAAAVEAHFMANVPGEITEDFLRLSSAIESGDLARVDAMADLIRNYRQGARILADLRTVRGKGANLLARRFSELGETERTGLMSSWATFQETFTPTSYADIAYAQRPFETALADALVYTGDPWLNSLNPGMQLAMDALAAKMSVESISIPENRLRPLEMPAHIRVAEAVAGEGVQTRVNSVIQALKEAGARPDGPSYFIADKLTGLIHRVNRAGKITRTENYLSGNAHYPGQMPGPAGTQTTVVSDAAGPLSIRTALASPEQIPGARQNRDIAVITIEDTSVAADIVNSAEQQMQVEVLPGRQMPDGVWDTANSAFPSSTRNKAANTSDPTAAIEAQATLEALADPSFGVSAPNESNDHADMATWDSMLATVLNASSELPVFTGTTSAMSGVVGLDSVHTSPHTEGVNTPVDMEAPVVPTEDERLMQALQVLEALNNAIAPDANSPQPASETTRAGVRTGAQGLLREYRARKAQVAQDEAESREDRFAPYMTREATSHNKMKTLGFHFRRALSDSRTPLLEWLTKVEPIALGSGEFDSHPLWMTCKLMAQEVRTGTTTLYNNLVLPYQNFIVEIAKNRSEQAVDVWRDIGTYATAWHVINEASEAFRQALVQAVQDAAAMPAGPQKQAALLSAQDTLSAYDSYQASTGPKVKTAGGMSNAEYQQNIDNLIARGYSIETLERGRGMLVNMGAEVTLERLNAGTLTEEEIQQWYDFSGYVPLLVPQQEENTSVDDAPAIFNPGRDHVRQGSLTPAMNASDALMAYVARAAAEMGGKDFREQLRLIHARNQGKDIGLTKTPMAAIPTMPFEAAVATSNKQGIIAYELNEDTGQRVAYKYTFADNRVNEALATNIKANTLLETMAKGTRMMARMYTKYRAPFAFVNYRRDLGERVSNLNARDIRDANGDVVAGTTLAAKTYAYGNNPILIKDLMMSIAGRVPNSKYGRYWQEFYRSGGYQTFATYLGNDNKKLESQLKSLVGARAAVELIDAGITNYNDFFNAIPAFAQYVAMRENNIAPGDAAFWTLDLMDMTAQGSSLKAANAFYPFLRTILQGGANTLRTLGLHVGAGQSQRAALRGWALFTGKWMAYTGMVSLVSAMGGDDEDGNNRFDALSLSQIGTYIPLFNKSGDGHFKLQLPFGISQVAWTGAVAFDRVSRGLMNPGEAFSEIFLSFAKNIAPDTYPQYAFTESPGAWLVQTFSPSILRPAIDTVVNKDNWGRTISYGSRAVGVPASESGRHRTPDIWHSLARAIHKYTPFDWSPESVRHFCNGYLPGPLQSIMAYVEQDALVKNPEFQSTRDTLGPALTALGAGMFYSAEMNIPARLYYQKKQAYEKRVTSEAIKLTHPDNRGDADKARRFVSRQLTEAGWSPEDIQAYMIIRDTDAKMRKQDTEFREKHTIYKNYGLTTEQLAEPYYMWSMEKQATLRDAVNMLR